MRRLIYLKIAGRDVHMPKLVGAFVLVWALLMFFHSTAVMFDSWDNLKAYERCVSSNISLNDSYQQQLVEFQGCATTLFNATGVVVRPESTKLTTRQFVQGLLEPIASIFFWLAVLFVGWMFYRSDTAVVPIEESVREFRAPEVIVRSFAKKKRR